jgi:uncharacterized membrane-anchored protein YjiN (DUF445 family)
MEKYAEKKAELSRSKMLALSLFGAAAALFVITLFLPPSWTTGLLKAFAEAAMIGALADWFAVVALFRRVPIPFVSRHTEIIPKNKVKIADNLALFVREKFLDTESIVSLIRRHDPAKVAADWLVLPQNAARLGDYLVKMASWALDFVEDSAVQRFIGKAVHGVIGSIDFSKSAGMMLEGLTHNRRHQELLNEGIGQLSTLLENEETQQVLAQGIVDWLREDYAFIEKMLPTDAIGRKGAEVAVSMAAKILAKVAEDPDHPLRQRFDTYTEEFVGRLKADPAFLAKGEEVKRYLIEDDTLNGYLKSIWGDLKTWLKNDLHSEDSVLRQRIVASGAWVGRTLAEDPVLRQSLNENMESAARGIAPEFAGFLTAHIADTVKKWDDKEMSDQIELNIGKDLQFIRINGTIVGGMIGVVLYLLGQIPALLH